MAWFTIGSFQDSLSLRSFKAYLAEFISTLLFVFAGVGSAIAYSQFILFHLLEFSIVKLKVQPFIMKTHVVCSNYT